MTPFNDVIITSCVHREGYEYINHSRGLHVSLLLCLGKIRKMHINFISLESSDNTTTLKTQILHNGRFIGLNHIMIIVLCLSGWRQYVVLHRTFALMQQRQWKALGTVLLHWRHSAKNRHTSAEKRHSKQPRIISVLANWVQVLLMNLRVYNALICYARWLAQAVLYNDSHK